MEILVGKFLGRDYQSESLERIQESNPDVAFDSTLKRELESLLECAQKKRECQEKVENAG